MYVDKPPFSTHSLTNFIWKNKIPCRSRFLLHLHKAPHLKDSWSGQVCMHMWTHICMHTHTLYFFQSLPSVKIFQISPNTQESWLTPRPGHFKEIYLFKFMFVLTNVECFYFGSHFTCKASAEDLFSLLFPSLLLQRSWSNVQIILSPQTLCSLG